MPNLLLVLFILVLTFKGEGAWAADREVWYLSIQETTRRLVSVTYLITVICVELYVY